MGQRFRRVGPGVDFEFLEVGLAFWDCCDALGLDVFVREAGLFLGERGGGAGDEGTVTVVACFGEGKEDEEEEGAD